MLLQNRCPILFEDSILTSFLDGNINKGRVRGRGFFWIFDNFCKSG